MDFHLFILTSLVVEKIFGGCYNSRLGEQVLVCFRKDEGDIFFISHLFHQPDFCIISHKIYKQIEGQSDIIKTAHFPKNMH
jgi:hypothetical protein